MVFALRCAVAVKALCVMIPMKMYCGTGKCDALNHLFEIGKVYVI